MAQTGAMQYALWSPDSWVTVYSVGKVISGTRGLDARLQCRRSIAGQESLVGGVMVPRISFSYLPEQASLLSYVKRPTYPAGALPELAFEAGTAAEGLRLLAAVCNRCRFDLAVDEALRVDMDWWSAQAPVATSGGSMAPVAGATFEWYQGSVTAEGISYAARRIQFTLDNNLIAVASLDTKPAGARRYPDEIVEGYEEVSIVADYLADPSHDLSGDEMPTADVQAQVTNGTETITLLAEDAVPHRWQQAFEVDDLVLWRVEYRLPANSGKFTITIT
ncbi:MAG: hypothetical protein J7M26_00695 [Armatimonadetes bacterium]|nr:hypothetical protein [Armatimonadota bacterium]